MTNIEKSKKMIQAFQDKTIDSAINGFVIEQNDEITNTVREYLDLLSKEELLSTQKFLEMLLNYCYKGKLFDSKLDEDNIKKLASLSDDEMFLLKESAIYFYGRLLVPINISILKKVYDIDDNKYVKLNATFASLQSFQEDLELDFVDKVLTSDEYDQLIRSWTMAYFKLADNPYDYVDHKEDDWSFAKKPRIKRLRVNDDSNPKFEKAMSFRLLDLVVLYLFINNRNKNTLNDEEMQIVRDANIDYERYSSEKKKELTKVKDLILHYHK